MPVEKRLPHKRHALELVPDFSYESRREFVEKLAHELWVKRGSPVGSPDVDWFAAEQAVYESLVASGMITAAPNDKQNMRRKIYRRA